MNARAPGICRIYEQSTCATQNMRANQHDSFLTGSEKRQEISIKKSDFELPIIFNDVLLTVKYPTFRFEIAAGSQ
jgi:hypothetical protein